MLRQVVNRVRFNPTKICKRFEHNHNSQNFKTDNMSKITSELEAVNKKLNAIELNTLIILSLGTGSIVGTFIGNLLYK